MIGSDTTEPATLEKAIKEELAKYDGKGQFEPTDLERVKRKKIGFFLRALNSIEFIANQFTRYSFNDMNLFDVVPVLEELTIEDLKKHLLRFKVNLNKLFLKSYRQRRAHSEKICPCTRGIRGDWPCYLPKSSCRRMVYLCPLFE